MLGEPTEQRRGFRFIGLLRKSSDLISVKSSVSVSGATARSNPPHDRAHTLTQELNEEDLTSRALSSRLFVLRDEEFKPCSRFDLKTETKRHDRS